MATNSDIEELFSRYLNLENEIKLLQDDKKVLLAEFKDRIDPKSFQSALRTAKIMAKIRPEEKNKFNQTLHVLEKVMCLEHIE